MLVGEAQLQRGFKRIHSACAGARTRVGQRIYLSRFRPIVPMNSDESGPHREVNMVCALDVPLFKRPTRQLGGLPAVVPPYLLQSHQKYAVYEPNNSLSRSPPLSDAVPSRPKCQRQIRSTPHLPRTSGRTRGCLSSGPLKINNFHRAKSGRPSGLRRQPTTDNEPLTIPLIPPLNWQNRHNSVTLMGQP